MWVMISDTIPLYINGVSLECGSWSTKHIKGPLWYANVVKPKSWEYKFNWKPLKIMNRLKIAVWRRNKSISYNVFLHEIMLKIGTKQICFEVCLLRVFTLSNFKNEQSQSNNKVKALNTRLLIEVFVFIVFLKYNIHFKGYFTKSCSHWIKVLDHKYPEGFVTVICGSVS